MGDGWSIALDAVLLNWVALVISILGYIALNSVGNFFELTWRYGPTWKILLSSVFTANLFFFYPVSGHPVVWTYSIVACNYVVSDFVGSLNAVRVKHKEWAQKRKSDIVCATERSAFEVDLPSRGSHCDYCVHSRYRELSYNFSNVLVYFFVQMSLFLLLTFHLLGLREQYIETWEAIQLNADLSFWCVCVAASLVAGDASLGSQYAPFFWEDVYEVADTTAFNGKLSHHWFSCMGMTFKMEWRLRRYMSFIVNGLMRSVILATIPILIAIREPLDAIKDIMCVFFIVTLDDLPDAKSLIDELSITYMHAFPDDTPFKQTQAMPNNSTTEDAEGESARLVPAQE
ncbi:unnamed protein product [Prorocentrum cordatum]|uniref:Autophagy-related protein 9 n=1 Tax=Prorocentrum cordatum TaxID=2364126 RepID=A0ABN9Q7G4_9DINO|nr:unnamed protein product [Polarella glacialis]